MADLNLTEITLTQLSMTLDVHMKTKHSFMLHGAPGVGKSQIIKDWCKEKGYTLVTRMLSQMQPSDFIIPHVDRENNITRWALADWLAELPTDHPCVLFFDELPAAPHDVQISAYQILLDREIAGNKLPEDCLVVAAGNRCSDGAIASEMGTAAADRLTHFNITVRAEEWLEWANKVEIHPYVQAFIKTNPHELLDEDNHEDLVRVSPRSWKVVSDYLYEAHKQGLSNGVIQSLLEGRIGNTHTATFLQVMKDIKNLHPVKDYIKALRKDKKKLIDMTPEKTTTAYGLMFSMLSQASKAQDYIDLMMCFYYFRQAKDKNVNYEEIFVSACTLCYKPIKDNDYNYDLITSPEFGDYLCDVITDVPAFQDLKKDLEEMNS